MEQRFAKVDVKCDWKDCTRIIEKLPRLIKEHNFCCYKHYWLWMKKDKVVGICDECSRPIEREQWRMNNNKKWCKHLLHKECIAPFQSKQRKGKSYEEILGKEKAILKVEQQRKTHKNSRPPLHNHVGQTKPEKIVEKYIIENSLAYKYTGDGKVWIKIENIRINPDFVNINHKKEFIEVLGCFWHGCPKCNLSLNEKSKRNKSILRAIKKDKLKQRLFKKYGYKVTYIWEHEIKDGSFIQKIGGLQC